MAGKLENIVRPKVDFLIQPNIPDDGKMPAAEAEEIMNKIDLNADRVPFDWDSEISANEIIVVNRRVTFNNIEYKCITQYDTGAGKDFTIANFEIVNGSAIKYIVDFIDLETYQIVYPTDYSIDQLIPEGGVTPTIVLGGTATPYTLGTTVTGGDRLDLTVDVAGFVEIIGQRA